MASSPGSNDTLSLVQQQQQQQLEPNHYLNNNNNNNTANGSSKGMARYQQDDAIVPTYEMEDDSIDEDDEYGSYAGEHEHHPHTSQEHSHDETRLSQNKYGSTHEQDEHQEDVDAVEYSTDYMKHHRQQREQRQQHLQAYKSQAMNIQHLLSLDQAQDQDMSGDDSQDEEEYYQQNPQHDPDRQHLMDTDMHGEEDDFDDDDEEEEGQVDEEMVEEDAEDAEDAEEESDAISLTEEDIDFSLVYAFHTFVATQEGQASVVRNDSLVLLEDSNVYWWLVRVLKSGVIGYIPAENIETPFERLARLNTYRNVATTAPSSEWGTFDEHVHPLDPATLQQRAANRRSVIFSSQNDYVEASETEWTDEEYEDGEWYGDEDGDGDELDDDEELQELEAADDDDEEEGSSQHQGQKSAAQLEADRGQQEARNQKMDVDKNPSRRSQRSPKEDEGDEYEDDEDVQITNRHRKPLLDEDDLFSASEPRVISLTPPIARDDPTGHRTQTATGKVKNLRQTEDMQKQRSQSPQNQQRQQGQSATATSGKNSASPTAGLRSSAPDSDDDEKDRAKKKGAERKDSKVISILGKNQQTAARKSKDEHEQGLSSETSPGAAAVKKPSKFKSLFSVGKSSSKDKERKEKEKQEKERLKANVKNPSNSLSSSIGSNLFRTRSNSNGSVASSTTTPAPSTTPQSPIADKVDSPSQEFMTLRVYPGNVDFGASLYKTVVINPATMASEAAHQAVIKFRLAPDGTASTGDFFLTVKGLDGDETMLQPTDKPMAIYQSLTAHLTTPLPTNHRLSISSVASGVSVISTASGTSNNNARTLSPPGSAGHPTLRRSGSGRFELQPSIRFMLNKKIRRPTSMALTSLPTSPTTPTAPQEDVFWVKVICQAQDLPQSMMFLDGLGSALEKADPKARGQSFATKAEHWIPMHSTSNAGDVVFKMLEKVDIRVGVVDGVPEHVLAAKRSAVSDGLVYEYQLGLLLTGNTSKNHNDGEEISLAPQTPLSKCFEEQRLVPIRRSPKADVASMPPHPGYVFFLRKSAKSLQAEMRLVQEQLQQQRQERKVPSPLQATAIRTADLDTLSSPQPSPTPSISSLITPTSPGPQNRNFNAANAALMNASRIGNVGGGSSSPVRVPRRADSVIMSPTNPLVRANSFDNTSERLSPTPSAQMAPRTPTPDRLQSQQQQQQQARTRSSSLSQGSPTPLARPFQAPSPAPSNLSSHAEQQEGSRPTTPEKASRSERQRATSPSLTHGPSPLSLTIVVTQSGQSGQGGQGRKGSFASADEILGTSNQSGRLSMMKNDAQGVDIALTKGVVRSSKMTNGENQTRYHYTFVPFESSEEIDISEIIEDILGGGDSDDEQEDQQQLRTRNESPMGLENMSRRERIAAAVARASQAVAEGKERRKANASSSSSTTSGVKSRKSTDRDRLELVGNSARGTETLLKLERALSTESGSNMRDGSPRVDITTNSIGGRNLPSPMSLSSSSPPSPTLTRKISDAEVHVASIATVGPVPGRIRSPGPLSAGIDGNNHGSDATSPGPTSPLSPPPSLSTGYTKATLLPSIAVAPIHNKETSSNPSSPSMITSPHYGPLEDRSYSPLPRPLQSPSPGSSRPRAVAVQTGATGVSAGGLESPGVRHNRSRSASTSMADASKLGLGSSPSPSSKLGLHGSSASESAADMQTSPTMAAWLLTSDYNKGMQELLTLVRAGRSSSVSTSAPSSTKGGLTYGKDGRIMHPNSSTSTSSPAFPTRQRLLSLQSTPTTLASSLSSMYNSNTTNHTIKDTQAHDHQQFDDISSTSSSNDSSSLANDRSLTTMTNTTTTHNPNANFNTIEEEAPSDNVPRMVWTRTDRRLLDVRSDCHPEVFECWREVDADLDKVEKELDSLLATVKATIF